MPFDPKKFREEKEREISEKYGQMRKRSFRFLFLNIMMVLAVFALLFFLKTSSPETYSSIVENLQIVIELKKLEYISPDKVGAKVYIVNTKRTDKDFTISEFYLKIYSDSTTVYEYSFPNTVEGSVSSLGKRLVYDVEREVSLVNLVPNDYTIYVKCKINGRQVETSRTFTYKEEISYILVSDPFYILGEEINPGVAIINSTAKKQTFDIEKIEWTLNEEHITENFNQQIVLLSGESHTIKSGHKFKASKVGQQESSASVYLKGGIIKEVKGIIPVTEKTEGSVSNVDFVIEAQDAVVVDKDANINLYIVNKIRENRFLKVDKIQISIPAIGYNFEIGNRRVFLIPFGRYQITKLERLNFDQAGVYTMIVQAYSGKSTIKKEIPVAVSK